AICVSFEQSDGRPLERRPIRPEDDAADSPARNRHDKFFLASAAFNLHWRGRLVKDHLPQFKFWRQIGDYTIGPARQAINRVAGLSVRRDLERGSVRLKCQCDSRKQTSSVRSVV